MKVAACVALACLLLCGQGFAARRLHGISQATSSKLTSSFGKSSYGFSSSGTCDESTDDLCFPPYVAVCAPVVLLAPDSDAGAASVASCFEEFQYSTGPDGTTGDYHIPEDCLTYLDGIDTMTESQAESAIKSYESCLQDVGYTVVDSEDTTSGKK